MSVVVCLGWAVVEFTKGREVLQSVMRNISSISTPFSEAAVLILLGARTTRFTLYGTILRLPSEYFDDNISDTKSAHYRGDCPIPVRSVKNEHVQYVWLL